MLNVIWPIKCELNWIVTRANRVIQVLTVGHEVAELVAGVECEPIAVGGSFA